MRYILLQSFETPVKTIHHGVSKTEDEWIKEFPGLQPGNCKIKKDWFKEDEWFGYTIKIFKDGVEQEDLPDEQVRKLLSSIIYEQRRGL